MKNSTLVGIFLGISVIGCGFILLVGPPDKQGDKPEDKEDKKDKVKKTYGNEDSFVPIDRNRIKAVSKASHKRFDKGYRKDLEQWGTKEGLIDVSNDEKAAGKRKRQLKGMAKSGKQLLNTYRQLLASGNPWQQPLVYRQFQHWLTRTFKQTQVTLTNTSDKAQVVSLWGANKDKEPSPSPSHGVEDYTLLSVVETGIHPQGMAYNPANERVYVANQLSNTVSVLDHQGKLMQNIQLQPSAIPGQNAPVSVAINTNETSDLFGYAYVVGSVANTVSVMDTLFNVVAEIVVGTRPMNIAYNPVNDRLYVANLVDNTVSVIHPETNTIESTLPTGKSPRSIAVNTHNGDIYIANSQDDNVTVYDVAGTLLDTVGNTGRNPVAMVYHPVNNEVYVVAKDTDNVIPINATSHTALPEIMVGKKPSAIVYHPVNGFMYVGNSQDETLSVIAPDKSTHATLDQGKVNTGMAIHPGEDRVFSSDAASHSVYISGYPKGTTGIVVDEDYAQKNRDIQAHPIRLKHARFIVSGNPDVAKTLSIKQQSATGTATNSTISFTNYSSPQNFQLIAEIFDIDGAVIDGKTLWQFRIAAKQTVSLLLYYQQADSRYLLPGHKPVGKRPKGKKRYLNTNPHRA